MPSDLELGAPALHLTLALFDLFRAAVSEKSVVEQLCSELLWWRMGWLMWR